MYERQHRKACGTSPGTICIITRRFRLMMGRATVYLRECTKWVDEIVRGRTLFRQKPLDRSLNCLPISKMQIRGKSNYKAGAKENLHVQYMYIGSNCKGEFVRSMPSIIAEPSHNKKKQKKKKEHGQ